MFRSTFYELYVSHFKQGYSAMSESELAIQREWARHKYLPLLEGLAPDAPVLEIGCGPGYLLEFLRQSGFTRAEGIDLSQQQVDLATRRGHKAQAADVFKFLEGKENRFDAIIAIDLFEHFSKEELMRLARAIQNALREGGILLVQTANGQGLFAPRIIHSDFTHMTMLTPGSMEQLLTLFSFSSFRFVESGPAPIGMRGKARVLAWGLIKAGLNLMLKIECGQSHDIWTSNMICACRKRS